MGLADSLSRAGAGTLRLVHQRLELAALDIEEELLRTRRLLAAALLAALLATLALAALGALVVIAFWDSARLAAIAVVAAAYGFAAFLVARAVMREQATKPPFLAATLGVLAQDRDALTPGDGTLRRETGFTR
jgi:uncharacterized membrane protein YqjE